MTSEHMKPEALDGTGGGIPPLHYGALSRWLEAHPELVAKCFVTKEFPRETRVFPRPEIGPGEIPRLAIMLSGELAVTQIFPGALAPHRAFYRGDFWVNPNRPGMKGREPTAAINIEAVAATQVLVLTEQGLRSMPEQEAGKLERILADYAIMQRARRIFFNAIRHTSQLAQVSVRHLHALLDTADVRTYETSQGDDVIVPQGSTQDEHKGIFLLLEGRLGEWREAEGPEGKPVLTRALYPGAIFGDTVLHSDAPIPCTVKLHSSMARVAVLPERSTRMLRLLSPLFASALSPAPTDEWERMAEVVSRLAPPPEVVLFRSELSDTPLEILIQDVAEATHLSHGDRILRVELVSSAQAGPPETPPEPRQGEVPAYRLRVADGRAAAQALQELALALQPQGWDYLFVHVDPRLWQGLVPPVGSALGFRAFLTGGVVWKLVDLSRDPLSQEPPPGFNRGSILYAALLPPDTEQVPGPAFPAGTTRLPLNLQQFASRRTFAQCTPAEQELFRRWGRAITERVVGVALGAGGSWGYAEIALIRGMQQRGIPIDVVSGTSFGAVAGAFYSALGDEGLQKLLEEGYKFNAIVAAAIINSSAISFAFDRMLDNRRLEKVALPFFPVGTNVSESQAWVLQRGTLGAGIRSSGIMPGLLSPAYTDDDCRVVDGAFINSVPVSVVMSQRANLIVGTNVLSEPPDTKDSKPLLPGPVGWFLHGLNPIGRLSDLVRSTLILFHTGGDQSASGADVIFDCPFTPIPPWSFSKGTAFVDHAASVLGPTLDEIEARWRIMATRRGDLLAKARALRSVLMQGELGMGLTEKVPA